MTNSTARRTPAFLRGAQAVAVAFLILHASAGHAAAQALAPSPTASSPPAAAPAETPTASRDTARQATQESVENPYGLRALWEGGDLVARGTIGILLLMSMGTWYVLITKFVEQTMLLHQARTANRTFWTAPNLREGADGL